MKALYHFFRLVRPLNLLVIVLTMGVFHYFVSQCRWQELFQFDFILLIISTLLIAAAGNIINDYFDIKADRVNKPDQLIIDKHIKRRWAILLNWVFNSIGLLIALYLSWQYHNVWIVIISFVSINLLWFYSMYFKRVFILGNVVVALLTGIVPIYVVVFNRGSLFFTMDLVWIYAGYAFWLNLIREIIKDIADIKGDLLLHSRTLPIVLGIKKTKIILSILFLFSLLPIIYFVVRVFVYVPIIHESVWTMDVFSWLTMAIFVTLVISLFVLAYYTNRKKYLLAANLIKLAMLFGLLTPLFL